MPGKYLHVVSFDVPFPPNYGGVIDVYYKLKALNQQGVKIHLHCFQYGRAESTKLKDHCHQVTYYKRKRFVNPFNTNVPYIVKSRINKALIHNLQKDDYPILLEGLHCTWPLLDPHVNNERIFVRTHNIEHEYYKRLETVESNPFKRSYFKIESKKLQSYERILGQAKGIIAISKFDQSHFQQYHSQVIWASAFHESQKVNSKTGRGDFILYHGNLSVGENNHAAIYLASEVFSKLDSQCIIVGNEPSSELAAICKRENIELKSELSSKDIIELVRNAHINVLPTFQKTGIKLKLLNALFQGRHCLVNSPMIEDTGLEDLCYIANNAESLIANIQELMDQEITAKEISEREIKLKDFENGINAQKISELIFGD